MHLQTQLSQGCCGTVTVTFGASLAANVFQILAPSMQTRCDALTRHQARIVVLSRVNEVDLENREARLTSQDLPPAKYTAPEETSHMSISSVLEVRFGLLLGFLEQPHVRPFSRKHASARTHDRLTETCTPITTHPIYKYFLNR